MSDQASNDARRQGAGGAWERCTASGAPWIALGLGIGAALGAAAGSLAWGLGVGAAVGLAIQQTNGGK